MKPVPLPAFEHVPAPYQGPSVEEVAALRRQFLNPAIFHYYKTPLMIVEGKGSWLFDEKGRRYLDGFAGIVSVSCGHGHPRILEAARRQAELLQHATTIYLHPVVAQYAQELAAKLPGELKCVYFVNSGSEANDLAVLMAKAFTRNFDVISIRNGYHGGSQSTMGMTAQQSWKFNVPHNFGVHHTVAPDTYRGPFTGDDPEAGPKYADDVRSLIECGTSGQIAAFIAESIQGVGGTAVYPPGYLKSAYAHAHKAGGLCIADEVQTGFGRTGRHYWGFESQGVIPDIVTMAKGIGNGCPLGAVVTTSAIAQALTSRTHFNTFGGNPVSCAQGRAVLQVIDDEGLQANCAAVGEHLKAGLLRLAQRHSLIGDVRGLGLMLGVELVKDRSTKAPARNECAAVFEACRELGLLVGKGGLHANTLRIKPPMVFSRSDADFMLAVLDEAFTAC